MENKNNFGYHTREIEKGKLGEYSKIREEFEELSDAVEQGDKILTVCELSDLIGAIEAYSNSLGFELKDLISFSDKTKSSFKSGKRT